MAMSWIVAFDPGLALKPKLEAERGIFVKNYIDQSQEFALCAVALAYPVITLLRAKRIVPALLLAALALSFVVNMAFVIVSRTALVTMPVMLAVFALLHLKWRSIVIIACARDRAGGAGLGGVAAVALDHRNFHRGTINCTRNRTSRPRSGCGSNSGRNRCGSLPRRRCSATAPDRRAGLFEQAAVGQTGAASAEVIGNPHNQTLNVAIQWGALGIVVLYAMWLLHLLLFRGDGLVAWIGLLVVVQNIFTSLFNSHIFDFHEGWMYVLGVGVAGGMVLEASSREAPREAGNSARS